MPLDLTINIVSVDDVLIEMGLGEDSRAKIERLVNAISMRVERYTNNVFKKRLQTMTLDGPASSLLDLGGRIVSVTSVTVGGTVLATTAYVVLPERGQLYRSAGWHDPLPSTGVEGVQNVTVVVTRGFDPIPYDVQEMVIAVIKSWHASVGSGGGSGFQSERIGDYAYTRFAPTVATSAAALFAVPADLGESIASVLSPYVRHGF